MGYLSTYRRIRIAFSIGLLLLLASAMLSGCKESLSGRVVLKDNSSGLGKQDDAQEGDIIGEKEIILSSDNPYVVQVVDDGLGHAVPPSVDEPKKPKTISFKDMIKGAAKDEGRVRVLIKLKNNERSEYLKGKVNEYKNVKNYVSGVMSRSRFDGLAKDIGEENVEIISIDHVIRLSADTVAEHIGAEQAWSAGFTGKGQSVCVIDSGIDYTHPGISANYIGGYDFVNNDNNPMDDNGHGTYVSGIIAAIAPDAKIISAKVFNQEGHGYESDIIAGINYCVQNKDVYNISVILMAFGGGIYDTSCYCDSNFIVQESHYAISQGLFAVAASGNDGEAYLKAPACGSNVTSVGAVDKDDEVASFSNIEPLLDLLAPGVDIESAKMGGGLESISGTSASAAVVAGTATLLLEKEALAPLDLQYRLRSTGVLVENDGTSYLRINAYASISNYTTNTPIAQQGTQCEGTWEDNELLAEETCGVFISCSTEPDPNCDCCDSGDMYKLCTDHTCTEMTCTPPFSSCACSQSGCGAECDEDTDCGAGTCDLTSTCTCERYTNCTGHGCFYIKNSIGGTIATFDSYGNLDIALLRASQTGNAANCSTCSKCLKILNSSGTCIAFFNQTGAGYGQLWLDGPVAQQRPSCNGTGFMIKNSTGSTVALINQSGGLCLKGQYG